MAGFQPLDWASIDQNDKSNAVRYLEALSDDEGEHNYAYCWGYTIFRIIYGPGSDEAFSKAIERLDTWIKYIFERNVESPQTREIWNRYKNEIIEDEILANASVEEVGVRFDAWVTLNLRGTEVPNSRYRFCIMLDQEGIDNILSLPEIPSDNGLYNKAIEARWIKVVTTWMSWQFEGSRVWIKLRIFDDLAVLWFDGTTNSEPFSYETIWECEDHGRIDIRDAGGFY